MLINHGIQYTGYHPHPVVAGITFHNFNFVNKYITEVVRTIQTVRIMQTNPPYKVVLLYHIHVQVSEVSVSWMLC